MYTRSVSLHLLAEGMFRGGSLIATVSAVWLLSNDIVNSVFNLIVYLQDSKSAILKCEI